MTPSSAQFSALILSSLIVVVAGCATTRTPASSNPEPPVIVNDGKPYAKSVDMQQLRTAIGMETTDLGFYEKPFNSCSIPRELRTNPNCETKYFTVINFQVVCRDSIGTVESVSEDTMRPMISGNISWLLGKIRGKTTTDGEGFGSVIALSSNSTSERTLILKVKKLALGLSAGEVRRIVVPKNWCR